MRTQTGHTLIELMISITLSSLILVGAISLFVAQAGVIRSETQRDQAAQEAQNAFDVISRLLRQAQAGSISITYTGTPSQYNAQGTPEQADDGINIKFTVPSGYAVWQDQTGAKNAVRITWTNGTDSDAPNAIRIAGAATTGALDGETLQTLAGGNEGSLPRVVNLDLWPLLDAETPQDLTTDPPLGGYLLTLTMRTASADPTFTNPLDSSHYRTYTASGVVAPRN